MITLGNFALLIGLILVVHMCIYSIVSRICEAYEKGKSLEFNGALEKIINETEKK